MERKIKEKKTKSIAEQDLYDIINSDVKWSKELEEKMNKDAKDFAKKMGWKK